MKSFIASFFHSKWFMQQPNATNEEDKTIRKKYILSSTKIVIWGCRCMIVEQAGLLCCYTVWLGNFVPTFWRNLLRSPSWIWVNSRTHNPGDEGGTFFETSGANYHPQCPTTQKTCFLNTTTCLQLIKSELLSFSVGKAATFPPH
jgi:hypothetical protein